jgi:hypothetical protein
MSKYAFVIEATEHAELSASSAERWMTCKGSPALIRGLPNHSTFYAAEGTAAHWIASWAQQEPGRKAAHWRGLTAKVEGHDIPLTAELCEAVQDFLDYIAANEEVSDAALVETSFTPAMRKLHPKFGGSTDRIMWRERTRLLRVYDYKHGAGVAVSAIDNKQLKYYALGALLSNPWPAETVELVIAQPRCDHEEGRFRTFTFKAIDLVDFAADIVEAAKETEDPFAPLAPSPKACKFCPAAAAKVCPAIEAQSQALVQAAFSPIAPERYSTEQIAEFLAKAPLVEGHISAIREFAYQEAMKGRDFPGFKLVAKRANRHWTSGSG